MGFVFLFAPILSAAAVVLEVIVGYAGNAKRQNSKVAMNCLDIKQSSYAKLRIYFGSFGSFGDLYTKTLRHRYSWRMVMSFPGQGQMGDLGPWMEVLLCLMGEMIF